MNKKCDNKPSLVENDAHHINHLPAEGLRTILQNLPFQDRKNARLVCKLWFQECPFGRNGKIVLRYRTAEIDSKYIKNCRLERLQVVFVGQNNFLPSVWTKIRPKIYIMKLNGCRLTESLISNVGSCENLEFFQMHLGAGYFAFRTDAILQQVNRVCWKMKTIEIVIIHYFLLAEDIIADWRKLCHGYNLAVGSNETEHLICRIPTSSKIDKSKLTTSIRGFLKTHKMNKDYSVDLNGYK